MHRMIYNSGEVLNMKDVYEINDLVLLIKTESTLQEKFIIAKKFEGEYYLITEDGEKLIDNKDSYAIIGVDNSRNEHFEIYVSSLNRVLEARSCVFDFFNVSKLNEERWLAGNINRKAMINNDTEIYLDYLLKTNNLAVMGIRYISRENIKKMEERLNLQLKYVPLLIKNQLNKEYYNELREESKKIEKRFPINKKR